MSEKELLNALTQIDGLLAKCVNPALTRADHDSVRQVMSLVFQRVKLSYKLEDEKKAAQDVSKQEPETIGTT